MLEAIRFVVYDSEATFDKTVLDIFECSIRYNTKDPIGNTMKILLRHAKPHLEAKRPIHIEYVSTN